MHDGMVAAPASCSSVSDGGGASRQNTPTEVLLVIRQDEAKAMVENVAGGRNAWLELYQAAQRRSERRDAANQQGRKIMEAIEREMAAQPDLHIPKISRPRTPRRGARGGGRGGYGFDDSFASSGWPGDGANSPSLRHRHTQRARHAPGEDVWGKLARQTVGGSQSPQRLRGGPPPAHTYAPEISEYAKAVETRGKAHERLASPKKGGGSSGGAAASRKFQFKPTLGGETQRMIAQRRGVSGSRSNRDIYARLFDDADGKRQQKVAAEAKRVHNETKNLQCVPRINPESDLLVSTKPRGRPGGSKHDRLFTVLTKSRARSLSPTRLQAARGDAVGGDVPGDVWREGIHSPRAAAGAARADALTSKPRTKTPPWRAGTASAAGLLSRVSDGGRGGGGRAARAKTPPARNHPARGPVGRAEVDFVEALLPSFDAAEAKISDARATRPRASARARTPSPPPRRGGGAAVDTITPPHPSRGDGNASPPDKPPHPPSPFLTPVTPQPHSVGGDGAATTPPVAPGAVKGVKGNASIRRPSLQAAFAATVAAGGSPVSPVAGVKGQGVKGSTTVKGPSSPSRAGAKTAVKSAVSPLASRAGTKTPAGAVGKGPAVSVSPTGALAASMAATAAAGLSQHVAVAPLVAQDDGDDDDDDDDDAAFLSPTLPEPTVALAKVETGGRASPDDDVMVSLSSASGQYLRTSPPSTIPTKGRPHAPPAKGPLAKSAAGASGVDGLRFKIGDAVVCSTLTGPEIGEVLACHEKGNAYRVTTAQGELYAKEDTDMYVRDGGTVVMIEKQRGTGAVGIQYSGTWVVDVGAGTPAEGVVHPGTRIVAINNVVVASHQEVQRALALAPEVGKFPMHMAAGDGPQQIRDRLGRAMRASVQRGGGGVGEFAMPSKGALPPPPLPQGGGGAAAAAAVYQKSPARSYIAAPSPSQTWNKSPVGGPQPHGRPRTASVASAAASLVSMGGRAPSFKGPPGGAGVTPPMSYQPQLQQQLLRPSTAAPSPGGGVKIPPPGGGVGVAKSPSPAGVVKGAPMKGPVGSAKSLAAPGTAAAAAAAAAATPLREQSLAQPMRMKRVPRPRLRN